MIRFQKLYKSENLLEVDSMTAGRHRAPNTNLKNIISEFRI